jgi:hypothetical protein
MHVSNKKEERKLSHRKASYMDSASGKKVFDSDGKAGLKQAIANAQAYTADINMNMSIFDQRLLELEKKMSTIDRRRS